MPLNDVGRRQARELADTLVNMDIELIVSSHLLRARQTAEELRDALQAAGHDVPATVDPRLAESFRGAWQGRTFERIIATEPETWAAYREHPESFRFPHGESLVEQQRRVLEAVRDAALTGRVALLVTHGGSLRLVRAFLNGDGIETFHRIDTPDDEPLAVAADGLAGRIDRFLGLAPAPDEGTIEASGSG